MPEEKEKKKKKRLKAPSGVFERLLPAILVVTVGLAFAVGVLWQKVNNLETGIGGVAGIGAGSGAQEDLGPEEGKLSEEQANKIPEISDDDHLLGSRDAKVVLIEYSDFECPFCARFHPTAQQAFDEYGGEVAWVYRHFPLDSIHSRARPAALASECVAELGGNEAFWKFAEALFNDQSMLTDLASVASSVGVSGGDYDTCVEEKKYEDKVQEQYTGGGNAGVTGTPGNFILNEKGEAWIIPGAIPFETLQSTIDEALAS